MARSKAGRNVKVATVACLAAGFLIAEARIWGQTPLNLYGRGASGVNGVVAAAKPEASRAGIEIFKMGATPSMPRSPPASPSASSNRTPPESAAAVS